MKGYKVLGQDIKDEVIGHFGGLKEGLVRKSIQEVSREDSRVRGPQVRKTVQLDRRPGLYNSCYAKYV